MRPNPPDGLAQLPICPETFDLPVRSLRLYRDLTARAELREAMDRLGLRERRNQVLRTDGRRGAAILAGEIVELVASGATHVEIQTLIQWVRSIADDAFALRGEALPSLLAAELEEASADVAEDAGQAGFLMAVVQGRQLSDAALDERLQSVRRAAAANAVLLRVLEAEHTKRALSRYDRRAS